MVLAALWLFAACPPPFVPELEPMPGVEPGPEHLLERDDWVQIDVGSSACGIALEGDLYCAGERRWVGPLQALAVEDDICALDDLGELRCGDLPPEQPDVTYVQLALCPEQSTCGTAVGVAVDHRDDIRYWGYEGWGWLPGDYQGAATVRDVVCGVTSAEEIECFALAGGDLELRDARPTNAGYQQIIAAPTFFCGLLADGAVRCWGSGAPEVDAADSLLLQTDADSVYSVERSGGVTRFHPEGVTTVLSDGAFTDLAVGVDWGAALRSDGAVEIFWLE